MIERKLGEIIKGHFCWGCLPKVDHNIRSKDNPAKTEFCIYCDHRAEGINSTALVGNWLNLEKSH